MKTSKDPRHKQRKQVVSGLFALSFTPQEVGKEKELTQKVWERREELDDYIRRVASKWPPERLNKIDLAILRLAVYELMIEKKEPYRVIIDEAVELAKELGSENSAAFVNGVLGKLVKEGEEE